jgi:tetratricopeptide (TPR) repeat protein
MKKIALIALSCIAVCADTPTNNLARYMLANYFQFGSDLKNAGYWYGQIAPDDKDSKYVYLGYVPYLAASQAYTDIVKIIPQLDEHFKNNQEIQILSALALEQTGKKNEAHARLITLNETHKANQELAFKVVQTYLERSEPENALKVIKNLLNNAARRPNNFIFHFMESQIYLQLNKKPEALAAIKQCIEVYPKFDKSWLLYAVLHEQEGKIEEAIKGYSTFLEMSPEPNTEIERHLLMLAFRQKVETKKNNGTTQLSLLSQASNFASKAEYSKALTAIDSYLAQSPGDVEARLLKIEILVGQKQLEKAAHSLGQWITLDTDNEIWLKTLHLLCYLGLPYTKALQVLSNLEKQDLRISLYVADIALRAQSNEQALAALKKADAASKDPSLKTKIALQMGIIYYEKHDYKSAQEILEKAAALGVDYPPVHNLLGYLYATKGNNLAKAHEHIGKALAKDPHNPHFLDTKALAFYKEQKFDQAVTILQKVAQAHPTDFSVLCHLGKCYFKQGDVTKATKTIKAAVQIAKNDQDKSKGHMLLKRWAQ